MTSVWSITVTSPRQSSRGHATQVVASASRQRLTTRMQSNISVFIGELGKEWRVLSVCALFSVPFVPGKVRNKQGRTAHTYHQFNVAERRAEVNAYLQKAFIRFSTGLRQSVVLRQ